MFLNFLLDEWNKSPDFKNLHKLLKEKGKAPVLVAGLEGSQKAFLLAALFRQMNLPILLVTPDSLQAERTCEDLRAFLPEDEVLRVPGRELWAGGILGRGSETKGQRMMAMETLSNNRKAVTVIPAEALRERLMPLESWRRQPIRVEKGGNLDRDEILHYFASKGYSRASVVENEGQFGARGDIIDFFPPGRDKPVRVTLFGDEVESLRLFNPADQRSEGHLEFIDILPAGDVVLERDVKEKGLARIRAALEEKTRILKDKGNRSSASTLQEEIMNRLNLIKRKNILEEHHQAYFPFFFEKGASWLHYLSSKGLFILDDPVRINESVAYQQERMNEIISDLMLKNQALGPEIPIAWDMNHLIERIKPPSMCFSLFQNPGMGLIPRETINIEAQNAPRFYGQTDLWKNELEHWNRERRRVYLVSSTQERNRYLLEQLREVDQPEGGHMPEPVLAAGFLHNGFIIPSLRMVVLTEDSFIPVKKKSKRKPTGDEEARIRHYSDLNPGDYVVHESHGIGRYMGLETLEVDGIRRDFLHLSYAGGDALYVPADQTTCVQKYMGGEGRTPKPHRLSSSAWNKTKARVRASVEEMAGELLEIYAKRESTVGRSFAPSPDLQAQFASYFPFEETLDQTRSIQEVLDDLGKEKPMDRLLCGDVGFGKTEVAMRAAFNVVMEGKQVCILAPTTILAQQHCRNFRERFAPFSARVEQISRFLSPARQREIIKEANEGKVDIVVGTHRLLSKDVRFADLGLIVVDEEHRFGVRHKEKLKKLRMDVDVLTLTATPIPRTLHMSMAGVRDLSLMETPPENRYPVQTYIAEYSEGLIREAIKRELARGGQAFFVFNRVENIEKWAKTISNLVPEARINVAHGQMPETQLETIMREFMDGEFDVLISTTIIEAGLDIPNVNTLIVYDADRLGLAQLYQLRGRVGRSTRLAYAYFTFRKERVLTRSAEKRLQAVKEFADLGSGFKVALRDLEIRGSGNILGSEQHGFISEVGFDLYCQLLEEAVNSLKGVKTQPKTPTRLDLKVDAYLPGDYVPDPERKIEIYQRVYSARSLSEVEEVGEEITDRFGTPPPEVVNLLGVARLRVLSNDLQVSSIQRENGQVIIKFDPEKFDPEKFDKKNRIDASRLMAAVRKYSGGASLSNSGALSIKIRADQERAWMPDIERMLNITKEIVI